MSKLLRLAALLLAPVAALFAQGVPPGTSGAPAPDCFFVGSASATGSYLHGGSETTAPSFDNTGLQCTNWHLLYFAPSTVSGISIELDAAPVGASLGVAGTFAAMTGAGYGSTNPSTATGSADIALSPATTPGYVQVKIGTFTGSGTVKWMALGYRPNASTTPGAGFNQIVLASPLSTVLSTQQAVTGSAVALATNTLKSICVKALVGNTINVYIGPSGVSTSTGMELAPGDSWCGPVANSNVIYVIASTTGASVSWVGLD